MRLVAAVAALLRRFRVEQVVIGSIFVLVAVTSLAVAAGPRLYNRVVDEGLRHELSGAPGVQRNLQLSTVDLIQPGQPPVVRVTARGDQLAGSLPESVRRLVAARSYLLETPRFLVDDPPNYTTFVTLRYQDGLEEQIEVVEGRAPRPVRQPTVEDPETPPSARLEVAISEATAAETLMAVGDRLAATVDDDDPLVRRMFPRPVSLVEVEVVGIFAVRDPSAEYWFDDPSLIRVSVGGTDDNPLAFATALVAADAYPDLVSLAVPLRYVWRHQLGFDRLSADQLDPLVRDLRAMESDFVTSASAANARGAIFMRSGLLGIIDRYLSQRATSEAVLSVAAIGPLSVATGAVALVALLVIARRRAALLLARSRGASGRQLLAAQLWEALLVAVPAAALGLLAAETLVPSRPAPASPLGALGVALAASLLLLAATWPLARRALGQLERDDPAVFRLAPRRLVFETTVVGLALAGAWLLRERGLSGQSAAGDVGGWDPFLAAVPALIGIAVGLVTVRLYPLPVRGLGWLAARRRGLVAVLGLRSVGRHPSAAHLPLLVLMLTMAIGAFSSVLGVSVERGQVESSWREIGADYRIEPVAGANMTPGLDPSVVEGVEVVARGYVDRSAGFSTQPQHRGSIALHALELDAYARVLEGSPVEASFPDEMLSPDVGPGIGGTQRPVPALVSSRLPAGSAQLATGDTFEVSVAGRPIVLRVAARADRLPGVPEGSSFVVAPLEAIAAAYDRGPVRSNALLVRGSAEIERELREAVRAQSVTAAVASRHLAYARLRDAPLVAAVIGGFGLALAAATAYAALAVGASVGLTAERRSRELAYLRTLGLSRRQVAALTVVEHAPPVVLAVLVGIALGVGAAWLLEPGLELAAFVGPGALVELQLDWPSIAVLAALVAGVVTLAVAISSWASRRRDPSRALRMGDE